MRLLFLLLFFSSVSSLSYAQIEEALQAKNVRKVIHFSNGQDGILRYTVDKPFSLSQSAPLPASLSLAVKGGNLNIMFEFMNPLKYSISINESISADPSVQSGNKFVTSLIDLLNLVNPEGISNTKGTAPIPGAANSTFFNAAGAPDFSSIKDLFEFIRSESLVELALQILNIQGPFSNCIDNNSKIELLKKMADADKKFYQFQVDAKSILGTMNSISSISELRSRQASISNSIKALETLNNETNSSIDGLINFKSQINWGQDGQCKILQQYLNTKLQNYSESAKQVTKVRKEIITSFGGLNDQLNKIISSSEGEFFMLKNVSVSNGSINDISISVIEQENQIDNERILVKKKQENKYIIRLRPYTGVLLEYAAGLLFTNTTYSTYGTEVINNQTTVSSAEKTVDFATGSMLNIIFNTGNSFIYPMFQIGAATGKQVPLLFFGFGGRLVKPLNHLAISIGPMFAWKQQLNSLKIGSSVTGTADIEKDLKYKFDSKPSLYLGIQYSF